MSNAKKRKTFQISWLQEDEFKGWLLPISYDNAKCKCIPCGVTLNCGKSELQKHGKSLKHRLANTQNEITECMMMDSHKKKVKDAEMKLAIFCIEHNISLKTAGKLVLLFKDILTDSKIAQDITLDRVKYNMMSFQVSNIHEIGDGTSETKFIFDNNDDKRSNDLESASEEENIQCTVCLETFADIISFQLHLKLHRNTVRKLYSCEVCKKSFKKFTTYDVHKNIHLGKSELECRYCSRVWKKKCNAIKHNRVHTKPYDYQCERCGKQFVHATSLQSHLLLHDDARDVNCNGERPYDCYICGRKFSKQCNLKEHKKLHVPVNKLECTQCDLVFGKQTELDNHMKKMHQEANQFKKRFTLSKTCVPIFDESHAAVATIEWKNF